ncbi:MULTISPECIES: ABC transporter substrate-binding protein [Rhodovulum]|uniref:Glycine betaine/proline transport system substrate-binding protein n=2 Tax=Rhodovulum TaxID=34008 RepID=A0A8E2VHD2_9RHOB|nr:MULTISPECIES: ABC transporter substrate-binding protein [Rhodovulum]PTW45634.1 glycine betaine/proline transport system substrate-binding protein [Rhodovulum kholense]RAP40228.1 glycine/betaine ABC transporter substrate-binding protein [Rhodovulum viride]
MKRATALGALLAGLTLPAVAQAECGEVSIAEMNWASASVVTNVEKFLMEQGYGCTVKVVPSDTVPAVTSIAENGEPDTVSEMWVNSTGEVYSKLKDQGKIEELGKVLDPGGVEGWWIPDYLAEEHPELTTIEGVLAHPDWVGGTFNNCPDGWGCRVVNDNLIPAFDLEGHGIEVFNHGSGETLATSMASAYEKKEPWFGYYWAPTAVLGKYNMVSVDLGPYDEAAHEANQTPDNPDPKPSAFPAAPVLTVVTTDFADREPEVAEMLRKVSFDVDDMSAVIAWMDENNASPEEGAVHYLTEHKDVWSAWLDDAAREKLAALLNQ